MEDINNKRKRACMKGNLLQCIEMSMHAGNGGIHVLRSMSYIILTSY